MLHPHQASVKDELAQPDVDAYKPILNPSRPP